MERHTQMLLITNLPSRLVGIYFSDCYIGYSLLFIHASLHVSLQCCVGNECASSLRKLIIFQENALICSKSFFRVNTCPLLKWLGPLSPWNKRIGQSITCKHIAKQSPLTLLTCFKLIINVHNCNYFPFCNLNYFNNSTTNSRTTASEQFYYVLEFFKAIFAIGYGHALMDKWKL